MSTKLPKINSQYAILDVTKGRQALERRLKRDGEPIPVTLSGFLTDPGNDDGISTEFSVDVTHVKLGD